MKKLIFTALLIAALLIPNTAFVKEKKQPAVKKIPIILDTDIGSEHEDTWALVFILGCPELDLKLVVTSINDVEKKAAYVAKILEMAGRTDIPIGIGVRPGPDEYSWIKSPIKPSKYNWIKFNKWLDGYDISKYPGKIYRDGVEAIVDTIMHSTETVTVLSIAPLPNISAALKLNPKIAEKAEFVGMQGSLHTGYDGKENGTTEYNVWAYPKECREVFSAKWNVTIDPLDTCGNFKLEGNDYKRLADSKNQLVIAAVEQYRIWLSTDLANYEYGKETGTTALFDTLTSLMVFKRDNFNYLQTGLKVTDDGFTVTDDESTKLINCSMEIKNKKITECKELIINRMLNSPFKK